VAEKISPVMPRWLKSEEAATYCGFSLDHFTTLARRYHLPKHGPGNKRFDRSELDRWMLEPQCFVISPSRRKTVLQPIQDL
jgi:hypothetical protein